MDPVELWAASRQTSLRMVAYDGAGPSAPTVVVLHGMATSVDILRAVARGPDPFARLATEGLNVLALDWPGHGRSGGRRGHLTYRRAMDAVATAADTARRRWDGPVGLFGTALGGVLAFYAALEEGGLEAVACHNVLDLRNVRPVLRRARHGLLLPVAGLLRRWLSLEQQELVWLPASAIVAAADLASDPALSRALRRHPQAVRRYDLAAFGSIFLAPDDKPDVSGQAVPTLIAVGSNDRAVPETTTRAFASRLTCESRLWVLPGGGHQLLLEHPEALLPTVAAFLRQHMA
ncbi:MAG: alpha/beta hydrolase [Actinomycetota bacterium]|nr:alpha/beta hydrolase [Actinomycetota bacterium]